MVATDMFIMPLDEWEEIMHNGMNDDRLAEHNLYGFSMTDSLVCSTFKKWKDIPEQLRTEGVIRCYAYHSPYVNRDGWDHVNRLKAVLKRLDGVPAETLDEIKKSERWEQLYTEKGAIAKAEAEARSAPERRPQLDKFVSLEQVDDKPRQCEIVPASITGFLTKRDKSGKTLYYALTGSLNIRVTHGDWRMLRCMVMHGFVPHREAGGAERDEEKVLVKSESFSVEIYANPFKVDTCSPGFSSVPFEKNQAFTLYRGSTAMGVIFRGNYVRIKK